MHVPIIRSWRRSNLITQGNSYFGDENKNPIIDVGVMGAQFLVVGAYVIEGSEVFYTDSIPYDILMQGFELWPIPTCTQDPNLKCECGLGENIRSERHYSWCPLYWKAGFND